MKKHAAKESAHLFKPMSEKEARALARKHQQRREAWRDLAEWNHTETVCWLSDFAAEAVTLND